MKIVGRTCELFSGDDQRAIAYCRTGRVAVYQSEIRCSSPSTRLDFVILDELGYCPSLNPAASFSST